LRKACIPVTEQGVCRLGTNHTVRKKLQKLLRKTFDPAVGIKCIGLEWLGHVTIVEQTRVTKKIFESKPESRRYVGRPRLRGLEDVDSDL